MKTVKLPTFKLTGELKIYDEGGVVENPFSGERYKLTAEELSVYDYIIGLQHVIDRQGGPFSPMTRKYQQDMRIGLDWFRNNNAEAYMVLLD